MKRWECTYFLCMFWIQFIVLISFLGNVSVGSTWIHSRNGGFQAFGDRLWSLALRTAAFLSTTWAFANERPTSLTNRIDDLKFFLFFFVFVQNFRFFGNINTTTIAPKWTELSTSVLVVRVFKRFHTRKIFINEDKSSELLLLFEKLYTALELYWFEISL